MNDNITKQDLRDTVGDSEKRLMAHIDTKMEPLANEINGIKRTIYGPNGDSGVVGDVGDIKNSAKWIKGFAGLGGLAGISGWVKDIFSG